MPRLEAEILLARGEALEQLGSFDPAEEAYRRAADASLAAGDEVLEARTLAALAHLHWLQDRFDAGREVLERALEQARRIGANQLLAQLLYTAGTLAFGEGKFNEALSRHEEALRVALDGGDQAGEALARHGLCETLYFLGPLDRSLDEGQRADRLFRALGQLPMVYHNLYMVAWDLWFKGRLVEAAAALEESASGSREVGNRRDEGFALAGSHVLCLLGDLGGALRRVRSAIDIAIEIQTPRLELAGRGMALQILMEAGVQEHLEEELERGQEITEAIGTNFARPRLMSMAGWLALKRGDPDAAGLFARAREATEGVLLEDLWTGWVEVTAAEDCSNAELALDAGERLARRARGESPFFEGWGRFGQALARSLDERWDDALQAGREIHDMASSTGDRMLEWRACAINARALSMLGRQSEAEVERSRAAGILEAVAESIEDEEMRPRSWPGRWWPRSWRRDPPRSCSPECLPAIWSHSGPRAKRCGWATASPCFAGAIPERPCTSSWRVRSWSRSPTPRAMRWWAVSGPGTSPERWRPSPTGHTPPTSSPRASPRRSGSARRTSSDSCTSGRWWRTGCWRSSHRGWRRTPQSSRTGLRRTARSGSPRRCSEWLGPRAGSRP
jgi:tetratricopeptide (TPR) repeat protein